MLGHVWTETAPGRGFYEPVHGPRSEVTLSAADVPLLLEVLDANLWVLALARSGCQCGCTR